jgi:L-lactate dehydrogenase (cytochrome)
MHNVTHISTRSSILGIPVSTPLMVAPAAMARLIYPDGELVIARAASVKGIIQYININASYTADEIVNSVNGSSHPFLFQIYIDRQLFQSEAILAKLPKNVKAILVTVDGAANSKRKADERVKADKTIMSPIVGITAKNDKKGGGLARIMSGYIDPGLSRSDVA